MPEPITLAEAISEVRKFQDFVRLHPKYKIDPKSQRLVAAIDKVLTDLYTTRDQLSHLLLRTP